eukprot:37682-Eustigmatos_ZCMA.PRE.1
MADRVSRTITNRSPARCMSILEVSSILKTLALVAAGSPGSQRRTRCRPASCMCIGAVRPLRVLKPLSTNSILSPA